METQASSEVVLSPEKAIESSVDIVGQKPPPRKLLSLQYNYSDSEDEEPREDRKARIVSDENGSESPTPSSIVLHFGVGGVRVWQSSEMQCVQVSLFWQSIEQYQLHDSAAV